MKNKIFSPLILGKHRLKNRIIRAATYEGMGSPDGIPHVEQLSKLYCDLANNDISLIITGFNYISQQGRAMQPHQCGIDADDKVKAWKPIVQAVHDAGAKICMQIAHTGRQTISEATHDLARAPSAVTCTYFRQKIQVLSDKEIEQIIQDFICAAQRCQEAGFDGIQVHCAHGYLIHQFLSPHTNRRKDRWGQDKLLFAKKILSGIREKIGPDFLLLIKVSAQDDRLFSNELCQKFCIEVEKGNLADAIEISYGTMEFAMNIFRGDLPLSLAFKHNPLFAKYPRWVQWLWKTFYFPFYRRRIKPFTHNYNLSDAKKLQQQLKLPLIVTGGIRSLEDMDKVLDAGIQGISLCRPLICEPDFLTKLKRQHQVESQCTNCNICTIMCDGHRPLRCYQAKT